MIEILYKFENNCKNVNRRDIDSSIINFFGVWNKTGKNLIEYAKNTVKSSLIFKISDTNDFIEPIINCKLDDKVLVYISGVLQHLTIIILSTNKFSFELLNSVNAFINQRNISEYFDTSYWIEPQNIRFY